MVRQSTKSRLFERVQGARVWTDDVGDGIVRFHLTSRWARILGFEVSAYLVGDLLIDTGFAHARRRFLTAAGGHRIRAICCTHNHEDHTGNCRPLAEIHHCPVYIRNHGLRWGEGVRRLKPYRAWWWGAPGWFDAEEMPAVVEGSTRALRVLPAPGHSITHVALLEEATGVVFTGDLFIAGGASAVMTQENPYDLVDSLRRVAAVKPRLMLTGHGLVVHNPASSLRAKADRVEEAAVKAVDLRRRGVNEREVVRRVFPSGSTKDRFLELLTQGEFSRLNFVRGALLHATE